MSHFDKLEYVLDQMTENNESYEQLVWRLLRKNTIMISQENVKQIKESSETLIDISKRKSLRGKRESTGQ